MRLNHLLKGLGPITIKGGRRLNIENISHNSKQIRRSGLFFAISGKTHNGYDFIDEAIERGAAAIAADKDFITYKNVTKVIVPEIRKACAVIAANFYSHPSKEMNITGITGTNGKTTTLYLISAIMRYSGINCGTIGTINYRIGDRLIPAINTTPSSISLQMFLREMHLSGVKNCVMEVSSHGLSQNRVESIEFNTAIFTNLTSEHLDYHKDMQEYFNAKSALFDMLKEDGRAIINSDDSYGRILLQKHKTRAVTYGIKKGSDVRAFDIHMSPKGISFKVKTPKEAMTVQSGLIGEYNMYNILAALAFAYSSGLKTANALSAIRDFKGAPGRLQRVESGRKGFSVFVDYAHTDDALCNVLRALKRVAKGGIITVFGCGGNRDKLKRPRMARVAAESADYVVITSDNPRNEKPKSIIDDIITGLPKGFKNYKACIDRKDAIAHALSKAKKDDIILIAGKGHETYQVFRETTIPFDDIKVAQELLSCDDITEK